jgi:hypothetical protein
MTDGAKQGEPELLGIALISLHVHHGQPVRLIRTVGPRAQQRRLPTAGRSRDDRHLPRRRTIKGSEKVTPGDQPGSCPAYRRGAAFAGVLPSRHLASVRSVTRESP